MTREEYKSQRLGAKIGELSTQVVDLEFAVQYLKEENDRLKIEIEKLEKENITLSGKAPVDVEEEEV